MSDVPKGWTKTTLGDLAEVIRGVTYKKENARSSPSEGLLPVLRATNISRELDFDDLVYVPVRNISEVQLLREGDIVIAASSGSKSVVGKAAILSSAWTGSFGAFCAVARPNQSVAPKYLSYSMQTREYREYISACSAGVNINNLKAADLTSYQLFLAPRGEQDRIVSEIDKQFTRLDAATAALKRVQVNLKRYRASVLKAACEGRLVPTEAELARKEGRDYEPADKLLHRILRERRARWEAGTLAKMQASGKSPLDDRWKPRYKEPSVPDTASLPPLPEGWCWTRIGYAFDCIVPNRDKPESFTGEIPWLTLPDFSGEIEIGSSKTGLGLSSQEVSLYRARVVPAHSVVMSCVGRFGITAVLREASVINQQLHAFIIPSWIPARFFAYMLRTQTKYMETKSTATTIAYLNKDNCNSVPIPIPPLSEQERIVAELDRQMASIDALERQLNHGTERIAASRKSILRAAFAGQLVPQDPTDEPASSLLERIRAERNTFIAQMPARRSRKEPDHA